MAQNVINNGIFSLVVGCWEAVQVAVMRVVISAFFSKRKEKEEKEDEKEARLVYL